MRALARGLLFGGCCVLGAGAWAADEPSRTAPPALAVRYADDKLSVDARAADPAVVLEAVARESGAELVGSPRAGDPITIAFREVSVKEALERLVGAQNFTLKYDDAGKLRAIELRGGQESAPRPPTSESPTADGNATPPKWRAFYKAFFDRAEMIPLSGDLKRALDRDEVGWDFLGNTAIGDDDPRIRAAAMRAMAAALEADAERKEAVSASLDAMTNEELAEFARKTASYRAEDLVRNALRVTSDAGLRTRARAVLHELRRNPYQGPYHPMR